MKKLKSIISLVLIIAMVSSIIGCDSNSKKDRSRNDSDDSPSVFDRIKQAYQFEAIDDITFKDAINEVYGEEPREYTEDMFEYVGYDEYDLDCNYYSVFDDCIFEYFEFEDEEGAREFFEDEYHFEFEDMIYDDSFVGSQLNIISDSNGFIIVNGECDGDGFWTEIDNAYGGIYWIDNIVVIAMINSNKNVDIEELDAFLEMIGYPAPQSNR